MTLLDVRGITKSFGAVHVLHGVDFHVEAGEVVGLVGDNGAGKSTLMKIVTGIYTADAGSIELEGRSILDFDPGARRSLGIEMIYQDLALARQQDVAANIFLGREPVRRVLGMNFVDRATMKREAQAMIDRLGRASAGDLAPGRAPSPAASSNRSPLRGRSPSIRRL